MRLDRGHRGGPVRDLSAERRPGGSRPDRDPHSHAGRWRRRRRRRTAIAVVVATTDHHSSTPRQVRRLGQHGTPETGN